MVVGDSSTNRSPLLGFTQTYFSDKKLAFQDFIIGELEHYKEARSHSQWEHEFLVAKMYLPDSAEVVGVLLIDREQRPNSPDIVRVVPGDTYFGLTLMTILAHLGYHPSNLGRTCAFASPPSVGEIASVLAEKSQAGGEYTVHNHNCYWYAAEVFDHCLDTYGGGTTDGPYVDDLGTIMKDTPKAFVVCLPKSLPESISHQLYLGKITCGYCRSRYRLRYQHYS